MTGRGTKTYHRKDNGKLITAEDRYNMVMLHQYHNLGITKIAKKFSLEPIQIRIILGKRSGGSCCG